METMEGTVTESRLENAGNQASEKPIPVILGRNGRPLHGVALLAKLGKHPRPLLGKRYTYKWAGGWGQVTNGMSRLGRLSRRIEKEILADYEEPFSPLQRRLVRAAAEYGALAEQARASFGIDPTVTRRTITVLTRGFQHYLANLETLGGLKRRNRAPADLPGTLRQMSEEKK